ncbi:DUF1642 domain-containing protein [Streptococcus parasanguinis]|uniref:DUF1642 domain-containing protein n=1 Tax=Streptococcus parasanguinis TaxID=1318 RepID=UPI000778F639|nr:DUF1642 domain-containing protein [Streptococcus parasanguinis]
MNKQELIKKIAHLPSDCSGPLPMINKLAVLKFIKLLDEPQKVKIPKFVAEWIEYCKKHNFTLFGCLDPVNGFESLADETFEGDIRKCIRWCRKESNNFARAWLDGYTVEKEKRYIVKFKNVQSGSRYFKYDGVIGKWYFGINQDSNTTRLCHTKEELEEAGFGEVFNSPLFEVEEVE